MKIKINIIHTFKAKFIVKITHQKTCTFIKKIIIQTYKTTIDILYSSKEQQFYHISHRKKILPYEKQLTKKKTFSALCNSILSPSIRLPLVFGQSPLSKTIKQTRKSVLYRNFKCIYFAKSRICLFY